MAELHPDIPPVRPDDAETHGSGLSRRSFLHRAGVSAAAIAAVSTATSPLSVLAAEDEAGATALDKALPPKKRAKLCYKVRVDAAKLDRSRPLPTNVATGDEAAVSNFASCYSKALPHDDLGEVDAAAYAALLTAVDTGDPVDFAAIPIGGTVKLENPQAGLSFDLQGTDSHHTRLATPPAFSSAEAAAEMVEDYWFALTRDVQFESYASDPTIAAAADDLSAMTGYKARRVGGRVTPETIFRGDADGEYVGPYISQFLFRDTPYGAQLIPGRIRTVLPDVDFMTTYEEWLAVQRGVAPTGVKQPDGVTRHIRTMRDLAAYVQNDALYQSALNACLQMLAMKVPLESTLPSRSSANQTGFVDFGGPHVLTLVTEVALRALKAAWFHKWYLHRRLRPEAFAGRVHNHVTGARAYPLHAELLGSAALERIHERTGTYLLPQAYPEGSPTHPSYPAGHAAFAGACVTMLKAFFDESFVLPSPVVPTADGTALVAYEGPALTIGGELDKLAGNIAIGRNGAGVHYRSDGVEGIRLGEAVAISMLEEQKSNYGQSFSWTLTTYDGETITI
jgi:hypothetical protein